MTYLHSIDRPAFAVDRRQFQVLPMSRSGLKIVWQANVRAAFLAEWFWHNKGSHKAAIAMMNAAAGGDLLPLGEPDWLMWPLPDSHSNLDGDVYCVRATWPGRNELPV